MKRREFLRYSAAGAAIAPVVIGGMPLIAGDPAVPLGVEELNDGILVIIQLFGGNDGLNTIIPCDDDKYYSLRDPVNGIGVAKTAAKRILKSDTYMHPALVNNAYKNGFMGMFEEGRLAIVQGIGYENPNLSHFRSTDIWLSGINSSDPNVRLSDGWIGRFFADSLPNFPTEIPDHPLCIQIGGAVSLLLQSEKGDMGIALTDPQKFFELGAGLSPDEEPMQGNSSYASEFNFVRTLAQQSDRYSQVVKQSFDNGTNKVDYRNNALSLQLKLIARLISGGLKSKVFVCNMGGFDTHVQQQDVGNGGLHPNLLNTIADSVSRFSDDCLAQGFHNRVIGMTVSEFGRRPYENGSRGTDHGASSVQFVWGHRVKGGVFGKNPDLESLDENSDLVYQYDYRKVYSEIIQTWFGGSKETAETVLKGRFVPLGILDSPIASVSPFYESGQKDSFVFPNPNNGSFSISVELRQNCNLEITIYEMRGKAVFHFVYGQVSYGYHTFSVSTLLPNGSYLCELSADGHRKVIPITITR